MVLLMGMFLNLAGIGGALAEDSNLVYDGSAPVVKEMVTLSLMCPKDAASGLYEIEDLIWLQDILKRANVNLEIEEIDSSAYDDVLRTRMAAGIDLPDIIAMGWQLDSTLNYVESGLVVDFAEYYEQYGYNLKRVLDMPGYEGIEGRLFAPDGGFYYFPTLDRPSYRTLIINMDWLNQLGMEVPTTADEYYDVLVAMKNTDFNGNGVQDEVPLFLRPGGIWMFGGMWDIDPEVGFTVGEDGKLFCSYTTENFKDMLTYLNKLYTEGLLYNEFATSTYDQQVTLTSNNQLGSIMHYAQNTIKYCVMVDPDFDSETDEPIYMPIAPLQTGFGEPKIYGVELFAGSHAISRNCEHPDVAYALMDYLYSPEVLELTTFGYEGETFVLTETGAYKQTLPENYNDGKYTGGNYGGLPHMYLEWYELDRPYAEKKIYDAYMGLANYMTSGIGTSFETPEEAEIISMYLTDLKTYVYEMATNFIIGGTPLSEFDSFVETVNSMHMEEIMAVYQAKYDRSLQQ